MPDVNKLATKADLKELYQRILPYLNRQEVLANADYLAKIGENEYGEATYNGHLLTIPNADIIDRANVYSTTEKIVGCWTDGRPIYQKTLAQTQIGSTSTDWTRVTIPHGISNFYVKSYFKVVSACVHISQPGVATWVTSAIGYIPAHNFSENKEIGFWADDTNVYLEGVRPGSWTDTSRATYIYVTIQYCKTSDASNSYNYAGENDYSTNEKIVGTWIDGKPLYQKTYQVALPTVSTMGTWASNSVALGVSADTVFVKDGFLIHPTSKSRVSYGTVVKTTSSYDYGAWSVVIRPNESSSNKNTMEIRSNNYDWSGATAYVTLQYTKTTD